MGILRDHQRPIGFQFFAGKQVVDLHEVHFAEHSKYTRGVFKGLVVGFLGMEKKLAA